MGTSIFTDADLDAMTAEEAWGRCCYAAWVTRRDERRMAPVRQAMHEARQEVARHVIDHLEKMTPEERAKALKPFEGE